MQKILFVALIVSFPSTSCWANLSGPWKPGQLLVDVEGVKEIAIVRETLSLDLRPLEHGQPIKISARYLIDHTQSPRNLSLTFITGVEAVRGAKCTLNGIPLSFSTKQVKEMPDSWRPPTETPGFVPDQQLLYSRRIDDTQHEWIVFTVSLQTGRQTIEVSYEVEAGTYYSPNHSARFWQTAYILAPAKTWKSFGGLDLEVLAPEHWQVKCNLPLNNQGQQWTASFDSLPADYIALTTQHPNGKRVPVFNLTEMSLFFGMMTFLLGLFHMIRRYRQVRQAAPTVNSPPCVSHSSWFLFLVAFVPLLWNAVSISQANASLPDSQTNYQLFVINVLFHGLYWFIFLAPLMLMSAWIMWLFCRLGSWLGKRHQQLPTVS